MNSYEVPVASLLNESDVEQKVILPLLTNEEPFGFGVDALYLMTKYNLRQLQIGKRTNSKIYYPDYAIVIDGIPLLIVEVKRPGENLEEALGEARLYATELNSFFKDINPCTKIIASDGQKLVAGKWDVREPEFEINVQDWIPANNDFGKLIQQFGYTTVRKQEPELRSKLKTTNRYSSPIRLLGGKNIQNQAVNNTFGETISIQYRHLFNPTDEAERTAVVGNAYVKVEKHLAHVDPIDKLIRKKVRISTASSQEIEDNIHPTEILGKLRKAHNYNNQVLLLVGSGGSGKSTFATYLKEVALDDALSEKLFWVRLDLNLAPLSSEEIYSWIKTNIVNEIINSVNFDTNELVVIKKIYAQDIDDFDKVAVELLEPTTYKLELFKKIQELKSNKDITLHRYIDYFIHQQFKDLIIVLDNCDKKESDKQLLMFEVANWLKENTKSIVFLPMRDTTFDLYKQQPPLDTVVKDLTFRINPPPLDKVLMARIRYAARLSEGTKSRYYTLGNGMNVMYPSRDEIIYLRSILNSLFQNSFFKSVINGLAGRDIRKGIEIFLDFCKSGHITDGEILQMKYTDEHLHGVYRIPNHIVANVFFRGNRKYYSDADTRVKSMFYSDPNDNLPDPFVRLGILIWLNDRRNVKGPSSSLGFHKVSALIQELVHFGHSKERVIDELKTLLRFDLIISETQNYEVVDNEELISINSPGVIHLKLLNDFNYLGAISEDTWFDQERTASKIADAMAGRGKFSHLSLQTTLENANLLISYLKDYHQKFFSAANKFMADTGRSPIMNFNEINASLKAKMDSATLLGGETYGIGDILLAKIVNIFNHGAICEFIGSPKSGFLKYTRQNGLKEGDQLAIGDTVSVKITRYSRRHRKYDVDLHELTVQKVYGAN